MFYLFNKQSMVEFYDNKSLKSCHQRFSLVKFYTNLKEKKEKDDEMKILLHLKLMILENWILENIFLLDL